MSESQQLPQGFEDLAPFVGEWGHLETQDARYQQRQRLPMARLQAFYDVATPRLQAIFDHLNRHPFDQPLPAPEALLFRTVMGMTEVAQAVEVFNQPTVPYAPDNHSVAIRVLPRA